LKKIPKKLVRHKNYNAIKEALKYLVYDSVDGEAFEYG